MPLRLIEISIPSERESELEEVLKDRALTRTRSEDAKDGILLVRVLLQAERAEALLDMLEKRFSMLEQFQVIILPVEAALPRPVSEKPPPAGVEPERSSIFGRMYREEVYSDVSDEIKTYRAHTVMSLLSSVVAAIGMYRGNAPVVIGAMVIAPLLGPNVALSFATTLGDSALMKRALKVNAAGIVAALIPAILLGVLLAPSIDPSMPEIAPRTDVTVWDLAIALVAGTVGALAFTTGLPTALVGVMVAVALLPPIVACGLLVGSGNLEAATGALLLVITNLICVNLSGVVTFLAQGIKPTTWWEADKAKTATRRAVFLWALLFTALLVVVVLSQGPLM